MQPATPLHLFLRKLRIRAGGSESPLSDAQLVERFAMVRDEAAFELLVWRHGAMVIGLCRRLLRHEQDAEDAFQATFLTLARKAESIRKREATASWLYKVAYRIALSIRQSKTARAVHERPALADLPTATTEVAEYRELRPMLDEEVQRLPEKYRAAFVLCHLEGKTNDEAAELLGCPKGTVLSRLSRAREQLRGRLTRRGVTISALAGGAVFTDLATATPVSAALVNPTVKAGLAIAAGQPIQAAASPAVAALAEGAIRTMFLSQLRKVAAFVLAATLLVAGAAGTWALATGPRWNDDEPAATQTKVSAASAASEDAMEAARQRLQTRKNLRAVMIGLHQYADKNGSLPPPALVDKNGKRLLSWRVLILPYLGENKLYEEFHRDEPWDSEHNKKLLAKIPSVYAVPGAGREEGMTTYQALVGPGAAFEEAKQPRFPADFPDGLSNTFAIVETTTLIPWTKPEDLSYSPTKPLPTPNRAFYAERLDGTGCYVSKDADEAELRKMITRDDGQAVVEDAVLFSRVPPKNVKESVPDLQKINDALRKALVTAQQELRKTQEELSKLRMQHGEKDPIALENVTLRDWLDNLLDQAEDTWRDIERLKKQTKPR